MTPTIGSQGQVQPIRAGKQEQVGANRAPGVSWTTRRRVSVASKFRRRPPAIRAALAQVETLVADLMLGETDARILITIIANCVSANDGTAPMFAKKETLARLAECSQATFYRTYARLREKNVLRAMDQGRHADGSLGITLFALTDWACEKLGLKEPSDEKNEKETTTTNNSQQQELDEAPVKSTPAMNAGTTDTQDGGFYFDLSGTHPHPGQELPSNASLIDGLEDEMRDGPIEGVYQGTYQGFDLEPQLFQEQSVKPAQKGLKDRTVRREGKTIPEDLSDLVDRHSIPATGVLRLMSVAKAIRGHRLSDIYAITRPTMETAGINGPTRYAYLLRCAQDTGKDWTWMAGERRKSEAERWRAAEFQRVAERMVGRWFKSPTGGALWRIVRGANGAVRFESVNGSGSSTMTPDYTERLLTDVKDGRLLPYNPETGYAYSVQ